MREAERGDTKRKRHTKRGKRVKVRDRWRVSEIERMRET